MKYTIFSSTSSFLAITFFFFFFIASSPPSIAAAAEELDCVHYVCDSDWKYVTAGVPYRVAVGNPLRDGDLSLEYTYTPTGDNDTHDPSCPRQIVESYSHEPYFIFNPIVPDANGRVPVEAPLAISTGSDVNLLCDGETGVLQMKRRSNDISFWHITADGTANTSASCFHFIGYANPTDPEYAQSYWLQNCPYKCGRGTPGYCQTIGKKTSGNWNYLTQSNDGPLELSIKGNDVDDELAASA